MKKSKQSKQPKSESRDISAYVCRAMVYGAISGHGISREEIERVCAKYSDDNPKVDVTTMPIVLLTDDGDPESHAVVALAKKHCRKCSVVSDDGRSVLIIGVAAKEIVSRIDLSNCHVQRLKTKMRVNCGFPMNRKMKCFGGERACDHVKRGRKNSK